MGPDMILLPLSTFVLTAALLGFVIVQRARSVFFPGLVAALSSILAWIGGMVLGVLVPDHPVIARIAVLLHFGGVCAVANSFTILSARFARLPVVEQNPAAFRVAIGIPSALCFAMVLTNPWHGQFGIGPDGSFFRSPIHEWRGPLYPLLVGWVYLSTGAGLSMCIWRALRTSDRAERRRLCLVSASASVPLAGYALHNLGLLGIPADVPVATLCLTASALIVVIGVARYGFLDSSLLPLRDVIDHLMDGLLLADLEGRVVEANPAAEVAVGCDRADIVGSRLSDVLESLGDDGRLYRALVGAHPDDARRQRLRTRQGRDVEVSCAWVGGSHGDPIGCFAVVRDLTEQQHHRELRHRTRRLESLGVLVGSLAHEISNPLTYVRANLLHLAERLDGWCRNGAPADKDDVAELQSVVEDSLEGVERIAKVVANTRRLAPREGLPATGAVDVNGLVEESRTLALRYAGAGARIDLDLAPDRPTVEGSGDRLLQVMLNLLSNACQAVPAGDGRVCVRTHSEEGAVVVSVEDNGPGVPESIRHSIFDPFFTTKGPDAGMGLGLSIVRDVVEEHGGAIELDSSPLGGAAFRIRLPSQGASLSFPPAERERADSARRS